MYENTFLNYVGNIFVDYTFIKKILKCYMGDHQKFSQQLIYFSKKIK